MVSKVSSAFRRALLFFLILAVLGYALKERASAVPIYALRHFLSFYTDFALVLAMSAVFPGGLASVGWVRRRWLGSVALGIAIWATLEALGLGFRWATLSFLPSLSEIWRSYTPPFADFSEYDWQAITTSFSLTVSATLFQDSLMTFLFVRLGEALPPALRVLRFAVVPALFVLMHLWWLEPRGILTTGILIRSVAAGLIQLVWLVAFVRTRSIIPIYVSHFLIDFVHGSYLW